MPYLLVAQSAPLQERILVAAIGPLITVVLGGLVVWGLTSTIQRRREAADRAMQHTREDKLREREEARADAIRAQDTSRADDALRHELVTSMTEAAGTLYLAEQQYWRAKQDADLDTTDKALAEAKQRLRAALDAQYFKSRADGEVIENRLEGFFVSDEPRRRWHQAIDLLTVRYFQLVGRDTDALYAKNAGPEHSDMSVDQLRGPKQVLNGYREALKASVRAVFDGDLRARS